MRCRQGLSSLLRIIIWGETKKTQREAAARVSRLVACFGNAHDGCCREELSWCGLPAPLHRRWRYFVVPLSSRTLLVDVITWYCTSDVCLGVSGITDREVFTCVPISGVDETLVPENDRIQPYHAYCINSLCTDCIAIREGALECLHYCNRQTAHQSKKNPQDAASHTDLTADTTQGRCRRRFQSLGCKPVRLCAWADPCATISPAELKSVPVWSGSLVVDELELVRGAGRGRPNSIQPGSFPPVCRAASRRLVGACVVCRIAVAAAAAAPAEAAPASDSSLFLPNGCLACSAPTLNEDA